MEGHLAIDNRRVAKSIFKDILISPNNDDIIIPISATFDKAVLHIGIGNGSCGIFIEKFRMKNGKEMETSVKHATRKFTNARNQRKNKGKDKKASKNEDIKMVVDDSGKKFTRDFPSMEEIERQLAKLIEHLVVKAPKKIKNTKDTISDTKPLKESKSVNIECDIAATDESIQSTIGTVFTSNLRRKPRHDKEIAGITTHSFDHQNLIEPNMNIPLYKRNEKSLKATKSISLEAIDKAYGNEMLGIAKDKEAGVYKPNCIRPKGFPLANDMHVYLDEVFVLSKRISQMFDEYVSAASEKRRNNEQQEDIPGSGPTGLVIDISKDNTVADRNLFGDVLGKDQCCPISSDIIVDREADNDSDTLDRIDPSTSESDNSTIIDRGAVDEMSDSDTLDMVGIESDEDIVDIEALALQEQDELDILSARNDSAKESKSVNIECDIAATDESVQSTKGTVFTSNIKSDLRRKPRHDKEIAEITTHSFDHQNLIEPNMNIPLYKRNEKSLKATMITSFEAIDKAYENEMLGIAMDKEAGVYKPNCIRPIGFPLADGMHVYLNEVFVISKRCSQMFDEIVSATKEKRRNEEQLEDIPGSGSTGLVIDISKDNTVGDINLFGDVLDNDQCCLISSDTIVDTAADNDSDTLDRINPSTSESDDSTIIDRGAVDEMSDSDTLNMVDVESDEDIVDIEALALQEQDEVEILSARNDTADNSTNDNYMVDDDDNLFGIMNIYVNTDLHFTFHNLPASAEHCDQKKDFGYKFFSFSTFFK